MLERLSLSQRFCLSYSYCSCAAIAALSSFRPSIASMFALRCSCSALIFLISLIMRVLLFFMWFTHLFNSCRVGGVACNFSYTPTTSTFIFQLSINVLICSVLSVISFLPPWFTICISWLHYNPLSLYRQEFWVNFFFFFLVATATFVELCKK